MKVLNIAWNGFGETGAVAIASALEECSLTALDLSCNRINSPGFLKICQAVEGNEDLRVLKVPEILSHLVSATVRQETKLLFVDNESCVLLLCKRHTI